MFSALTNSPAFIYIKLGLIAAVLAGTFWVSWQIRGVSARKEVAQAVDAAREEFQKGLDEERAKRAAAESLADERLGELLKSMTKVQEQAASIGRNIARERGANPTFYNQPLPPEGVEQWKRARSLLISPAASSSAP